MTTLAVAQHDARPRRAAPQPPHVVVLVGEEGVGLIAATGRRDAGRALHGVVASSDVADDDTTP